MYPASPIQLLQTGEDHKFLLDEDALKKVLLQEDIKDRFVIVVSVAGAFRKGKSFLLNFFLRYMYSTYVCETKTKNWLGGDNDSLKGFSWRGGHERDTTGILMWSDIFLHDYPNGKKVAIILLDTQGAFDNKNTVRECATIFALSTMVSSVQIFNLSQNIQEDDLQHLQLFTEYGRLALAESGEKPFQKLQFLVRDWSYPYDMEYGAKGGEILIDKYLEMDDNQHPELQSLRRHIKSCFENITCFLMPHPGLKVATNPTFDGRLADIEDNFKANLEIFAPQILAPENLLIKKINGQSVRASELIQYFISYMNIFNGSELPEPKNIFYATAEANNLAAVLKAKDRYVQRMEEICRTKPSMSDQDFERHHMRIMRDVLYEFTAQKKIGGEDFSRKYRQQLENDLQDKFYYYREHIESKKPFLTKAWKKIIEKASAAKYTVLGAVGVIGAVVVPSLLAFILNYALSKAI